MRKMLFSLDICIQCNTEVLGRKNQYFMYLVYFFRKQLFTQNFNIFDNIHAVLERLLKQKNMDRDDERRILSINYNKTKTKATNPKSLIKKNSFNYIFKKAFGFFFLDDSYVPYDFKYTKIELSIFWN